MLILSPTGGDGESVEQQTSAKQNVTHGRSGHRETSKVSNALLSS